MRRCFTTWEAEMTAEEHEFLLGVVRNGHFRDRCLEIGTAAGGTLWRMIDCLHGEHRPQFVVVDRMTYFPDQLDTVRENLREHNVDPASVDFRVTTSALAFREAVRRRDTFDFILVDASHKILAVMADLRWARLLNVGGVVCFHDYGPRFPGVRWPVDRLLARYKNYQVLGRAGSLLALQKTATSVYPEVTASDRAFSVAWYLPLEARRKFDKWKRQARRAA